MNIYEYLSLEVLYELIISIELFWSIIILLFFKLLIVLVLSLFLYFLLLLKFNEYDEDKILRFLEILNGSSLIISFIFLFIVLFLYKFNKLILLELFEYVIASFVKKFFFNKILFLSVFCGFIFLLEITEIFEIFEILLIFDLCLALIWFK